MSDPVCTVDGQLFFRAFRGTRIAKLVQLSKLDTSVAMGLGTRRTSLGEDDARLMESLSDFLVLG